MLRIGLDAMGGDYAPKAAVEGAILALAEIDSESRIVLFGDKAQILEVLAAEGCSEDNFDIVPTSEVIEMGDSPATAFVKKPDSSIVVGFGALMRGKIDGFASAGSTGAMMAGCVYVVKSIEGVMRPTISSLAPTTNGGTVVILDVGLNVDAKPEVLSQYGLLGSVYAQSVLGIESPRVALLSIGEEREKGNAQVKATHELLAERKDINFVGNLESKYIFNGEHADVVVCDGFVGNTMLKLAESFYVYAKSVGIKQDFTDRLNYEVVGGTPVLGINAPVIIGHGCSSALAIKNMILQTETTIKADIVNKLKAAL